jgi:iron complex transport system substrate-binding protein
MTGIRALAVLVLGLALGAAADAASTGLVLRDDLQREVTLPRNPQRIVTLVPSLTEIVCALGACGRLVATDEYSNWPAQVKTLPKAGGFEDPQIEQIISLKPNWCCSAARSESPSVSASSEWYRLR